MTNSHTSPENGSILPNTTCQHGYPIAGPQPCPDCATIITNAINNINKLSEEHTPTRALGVGGPSRGTLIARDWTANVRDHSTSIIDEMITRLQELRATIELECDITNHRMAGFVTLCEDAIKKTSEIGLVVSKLEHSRTFTEAHPATAQPAESQ